MKQLLLICLFIAALAKAQTPVYRIDTNRQVHHIEAFVLVLVDSFNRYGPGEITSGNMDNRFIPFATLANTKNDNYVCWLRTSLQSPVAISNWIILLQDEENSNSLNNSIEAYYVDKNHRLAANDKAGPLIPRSQKSIKHPAGFNGFSFSIPANEIRTTYIKISNPFSGSNTFSAPVIQHPSIPVAVHQYAVMLRMLNIISLLFCILSFFFYFFVKEKAYLFFAFYTLLLSQHYLILHPDMPFISAYIPEHPQLVTGFWYLLTFGSFYCFCLFGRSFINLPLLSSKTDVWYRRFLIGWAVITGIQLISLFTSQQKILPFFVDIAFAPVTLFFFVRFAFFKTVLARLFVGGALWLVCFTILGGLYNAEIIRLPFNPWPIGQVGQLLIFAAGLAYKVRLNERARADADRIKEMDIIKSRFFANVSHEFRTPLTLIQGPLQQIEEMVTSSKEAVTVPLRHLKTMRRNTDRLLELVNQLLDISKPDSGKMKLRIIKGDVLQLLKSLTASFESVAERKGIHYRVQFPEASSIGFFDKDKLEKIVSNLLANAFKYTPEGGTVSVEVANENEKLSVVVTDTGTGIPKKELDKIFDRFYQMEGTEDKGSGIGLALVKELVSLYRGQISVNSEPGKGSRFRVTLPHSKLSFKEDELVYGQWKSEETFINRNLEEDKEAIAAKKPDGQLPLLLLVEDNPDLRQFITETVQHQYNVIEAVNGQDGWEKAMSEIPDIIVSDVMMPVMDGFALTQKLKKDERTSHIPIILLTAKAGQAHKLDGLTTGADDYLTKPFDAPELLVRLQNLINQRKLLRRKFAGEILLNPSEVAVSSAEDIFLQKLMAAIEANLGEEDFGVEELAKEVAMSRSQLHRKLVALTGQSPSEVLRNTRLLRAKELLQKKSATASEVAFQVGFASHAYFSKCFKEEFGVSPSELG